MRTWFCPRCGFWYDERAGAIAMGIAPMTPWSAVPATWTCPDCGTPKREVQFSIGLYPDVDESHDARIPSCRRPLLGRRLRRLLLWALRWIPEVSLSAREQLLADPRPCDDRAASISPRLR